MKAVSEVIGYGSLRREAGENRDSLARLELEKPTSLRELLQRLAIRPERVQLVMVNHRAVSPDHLIHPGDRVALFPKEYAIFADWKNLRF
jgi:molybdopterin converting factor small subunit